MKISLRLVLAAALALLSAGCSRGPGAMQPAPQPGSQPAAQPASQPAATRTIVVYSPHGDDILREFAASFEAAHPGFEVVALDMGSNAVLDRLRGERENPHCDVWWGAPTAIFMLAASEGLLAPYEPSWAAHTTPAQQDVQHRWQGVFKLPIVVGYNREVTRPGDLPDTWDEVVDPRYRGQIVIRHPLESGTMTTLYTAQVYRSVRDTGAPDSGYEWLLKLDAATASYEPIPQAMYDAVARDGRGRWTLWGLSDLMYQSTNPSDPLPFGFKPLRGETPVILDCIALVAGGREPEGARLFYEHVTSPESLAILAHRHQKIPVRDDVDPSALPEWMRNLDVEEMEIDWQMLSDHTAEWMNHWDLEIQGKGSEALEGR